MTNTSTLRFPALWPGFAAGGIGLASFAAPFAFGIMSGVDPNSATLTPVRAAQILGFICLILGAIYWFVCVYRVHKVLLGVTQDGYPITAGRSVGYQFIPLYNIYWMFKWPGEIVEFINQTRGEKVINKSSPGCFLLLSSFAGRFVPGIGPLINFSVLRYLIQNVQKVIEAKELPIAYSKPKKKASALFLWLLLIPILGLLAAIAIPNIMRAKQNMQTRVQVQSTTTTAAPAV